MEKQEFEVEPFSDNFVAFKPSISPKKKKLFLIFIIVLILLIIGGIIAIIVFKSSTKNNEINKQSNEKEKKEKETKEEESSREEESERQEEETPGQEEESQKEEEEKQSQEEESQKEEEEKQSQEEESQKQEEEHSPTTHHPTLEELDKEYIPEIEMNEHLNKITNKIYLGEDVGATDLDYFEREGIKYVISMIGPVTHPDDEKKGIIRKIIDIEDIASTNIIRYFGECIEFIEKVPKVYVHCQAGMSRSATIVISYLMWKTHSSYQDVYNFVQIKRSVIGPNYGFVSQMQIFEELLVKNNYDLTKINFDDNYEWEGKYS